RNASKYSVSAPSVSFCAAATRAAEASAVARTNRGDRAVFRVYWSLSQRRCFIKTVCCDKCMDEPSLPMPERCMIRRTGIRFDQRHEGCQPAFLIIVYLAFHSTDHSCWDPHGRITSHLYCPREGSQRVRRCFSTPQLNFSGGPFQ